MPAQGAVGHVVDRVRGGGRVGDPRRGQRLEQGGRQDGAEVGGIGTLGLDAGGEEGPVRSAGLVVCGAVAWPETDLRVDWHDRPIAELAGLWRLWEPQAADYMTRALDPAAAPSYGVPGDEG